MDAVSFGDRVKALRERTDLSQREADKLAGLHRGHTWQVEEGHRENPTSETLRAYAGLFDVSLDWLVCGRGPDPDPEAVRAAVERARAARDAATTRAA